MLQGFGKDAQGNRTGFNTMVYSEPEVGPTLASAQWESGPLPARKKRARCIIRDETCSTERSEAVQSG